MYTKLANSILTSTVWMESNETRIVWLTLLAMCDKNGEVQASIPGLANVARVTVQECETAIQLFLSPDPYSRTKSDEGRRLEEIDGGWFVINHNKYRDLASDSDIKQKAAERQRRYRERQKRNGESVTESVTSVTERDSSHQISHTDTKAKAKTKNKTQDFVFPSDLDTTEFREAWNDWVEFRKDIKHGLTAKTIEAQMNKFAKWGVAKSIAAIRKSIENGWQGLFEPTEGPAAVNGSASIEDDWDEVKAIVLEKYHPDVRCTKRIEQILTPEQFKAVIEVSPRKIWDSDRFDKVVPAAYRRARKGQL